MNLSFENLLAPFLKKTWKTNLIIFYLMKTWAIYACITKTTEYA